MFGAAHLAAGQIHPLSPIQLNHTCGCRVVVVGRPDHARCKRLNNELVFMVSMGFFKRRRRQRRPVLTVPSLPPSRFRRPCIIARRSANDLGDLIEGNGDCPKSQKPRCDDDPSPPRVRFVRHYLHRICFGSVLRVVGVCLNQITSNTDSPALPG